MTIHISSLTMVCVKMFGTTNMWIMLVPDISFCEIAGVARYYERESCIGLQYKTDQKCSYDSCVMSCSKHLVFTDPINRYLIASRIHSDLLTR